MKLIISKQALSAAQDQYMAELRPALAMLGVPAEQLKVTEFEEIKLANISLTSVNDTWVLEVNDLVMLKHASAIGRFARIVAPIAFALKTAFEEFSQDLDRIQHWLVKGE